MDYQKRSLVEGFQDTTSVDLDYTAQISLQMNVPDRLYPIANKIPPNNFLFDRGDMNIYQQMNIPDKIVVLGHDESIGINAHDYPTKSNDVELYVNVQTPPKVISLLEDNFPVVSEFTEKTLNAVNKKLTDQQNLQKQIDKLSRQIKLLENQNQSRFHRELLFYPLLLGFVVFQVARLVLSKN